MRCIQRKRPPRNRRMGKNKKTDKHEAREHHFNQTTKKWGKWTTSKQGTKTLKRHRDQLLECTQELFSPEQVVKHAGHSTRKVVIEDANSSVVK